LLSHSRFALSTAILLTLTIALVCQFVQHTDDVFPLLYFTVDSAAFAAGAAGVALLRPTMSQLSSLRAASAVGVLLSAAIYAIVIAPASETGTWVQPHDDNWVRAATLLFHLVAPILVTLDFIVQDIGRAQLRTALTSCFAWPVVYLMMLGALASCDAVRMPYAFLDPSQVSGWTMFGTLVALGLLILILSATLWRTNQWWHKRIAGRRCS
jgi:hypothetical protein